MHVHSVCVHRPIELSSLSLQLRGAIHGPAIFVPKRVSPATNDYMPLSTYARLELITLPISLRRKPNKNLNLAQRSYKKNYSRCVRLTSMFRVGSHVFWMPVPFLPGCNFSASEMYYRVLAGKKAQKSNWGIQKYVTYCSIRPSQHNLHLSGHQYPHFNATLRR